MDNTQYRSTARLITKIPTGDYIEIGVNGKTVKEINIKKTLDHYILKNLTEKEKEFYYKFFADMDTHDGNVLCFASEYFGPEDITSKKLTDYSESEQLAYKKILAAVLLDIRNRAKKDFETTKNDDLKKRLSFFYCPDRESPFNFGPALHFSSFDNVYIVNDVPVITMYGYEKAQNNAPWTENTTIETFFKSIPAENLKSTEELKDAYERIVNDKFSALKHIESYEVTSIISMLEGETVTQKNTDNNQNNNFGNDSSDNQKVDVIDQKTDNQNGDVIDQKTDNQNGDVIDQKTDNQNGDVGNNGIHIIIDPPVNPENRKFIDYLKCFFFWLLMIIALLVILYLIFPQFRNYVSNNFSWWPWHSHSIDTSYQEEVFDDTTNKVNMSSSTEENTVISNNYTSDSNENFLDSGQNNVIPPAEGVIDQQNNVIPPAEDVIDQQNNVIPPAEDVIDQQNNVISPAEDVIDQQNNVIPPAEDVIDQEIENENLSTDFISSGLRYKRKALTVKKQDNGIISLLHANDREGKINCDIEAKVDNVTEETDFTVTKQYRIQAQKCYGNIIPLDFLLPDFSCETGIDGVESCFVGVDGIRENSVFIRFTD